MKLKTLLTYTLLTASTLLLFSCHNSFELIKKRYSHGYYASFTREREKKNPVPAHQYHAADSAASSSAGLTATQPDFQKPSVLKPSISNSENLTASIAKIETLKPKAQKIKPRQPAANSYEQNFPHHFIPAPFLSGDGTSSPVIPLSYKIAVIFLLLSLLSLVCTFAGAVFTVRLFSIIGGFFPEFWLTGIILALVGLIKFRKIPDTASPDPKRPDRFSHIAFILEMLELIMLPLIVVATFLILHSVTPLTVLVCLFLVMFFASFVLSIIGLIRVLKDPLQSKKNRLKAILISIFALVPLCLLVAWFAAIASFAAAIASALPYIAVGLFILHG